VLGLWRPIQGLEEIANALTALISVFAGILLLRGREGLLQMPTAEELSEQIEKRLGAERVARDKEQWILNFVESVEDYAIYVIDTDGIIQTWNLGAQRMKGYSAEEVIGQSVSLFYSEEDRAQGKLEKALKIAAETGRFEEEAWRVRKDGSRFSANLILRPLVDADGVLQGFSKVTRDLTQTKEMEARYQMLLEAAPDAILIVDSAGSIDFVNKAAEELFGYAREEILAKSVDMLVPPRTREAQAIYRERLFEGSSHPSVSGPAEVLGLRKDGSDFPLDFRLRPLETSEGRLLLFAVRDLSVERRTEARFRTLLESAPDAMVIVDPEGKIQLCNLQTVKLFGYSAMELVGQSVDILLPESLRVGHEGHRAQFLANPTQREMGVGLDLMARRKDGSLFPVEIALSPLEGPNGSSVTAAIRDITERKTAAVRLAEKIDELRHTNDALQQFVHIASHDLQEPLRMVTSYTQLLAKRYKGRLDSDADEFIGFAVDGTQRMKRLIEDLLAYSRSGSSGIARVPIPSEEALREAIGNLYEAIKETGAIVTHDPLPPVLFIYSQLVQIFQNLIGNAIKYRGERTPQIHVSFTRLDSECRFSVADNGIGIAPEYFERIFLIFQRLHGLDKYEGTGIGLAICQRIVHQQGGRIWVESVPDQGSTFHFTVPTR
jgi:PAS domain S-box-containing protein